ncbi:RagB/SusD family nutrient uptake outer membrane protein [Sphingobacterium sp. SGG-5]|uniref:RagB/SusD family nutrient uptake outer membrane protein n=1 Tax=Sphingobacterium sp. SGG-5 TaxID=2710881 RepID=UPI0013EA563B|nr:RagB/SusD family nutrient uptake outer membrane protein [Sphingobacterium sp. SGG-5]NGM61211.1 RagB/SusD family nutrient uptake outer membrane protein [Sphingobacterium sp. SGG-5]
MKTSNKFKYGLLGLILFLSGCEKFLEVGQPDNLIKDEFWQNRDQVQSSLNGLYTSLNSCLNLFQAWGDIRSSLYAPGSQASSTHTQFISHDIYTQNSLLNWSNIYRSIGWINAFIKNAPTALQNDPTFKEEELNGMLGEAHALRALYYFYLVRAFKEVPIIKDPYESDTQNLSVAASSENEVLDFIEEDLRIARDAVPETFLNNFHRFGRITRSAVAAIMADVKLWRNEYDACIDLCELLDATYESKLVEPSAWYTIFSPGNSPESIFEFQYTERGPSSPLYNWFVYHDGNSRDIYLANKANIDINAGEILYPPTGVLEHFSADTIRLKNYSAFTFSGAANGFKQAYEVYKFLGQAPYQRSYRNQSDRVAHYIFYRYREIMFMKAEAYAMKEEYEQAEAIINIIRQHCDLPDLAPGEAGQGVDFFTWLLMEREFELGFEGKEWFAAVRISRRPGYENVLIEKAATNHSMGRSYQVIRARLLDKESWFLPYYRTEVERNPLLQQKDFYKNK